MRTFTIESYGKGGIKFNYIDAESMEEAIEKFQRDEALAGEIEDCYETSNKFSHTGGGGCC